MKTEILDKIDKTLPTPPATGRSLLMMVGLPGTGKTSIVHALKRIHPCVVISTDHIRTFFQDNPTYTLAEMSSVYALCYAIMKRRLRKEQRVVFDASNYLAIHRQRIYDLANQMSAPLAICAVQAAEETIYNRLTQRMSADRSDHDLSEADWSVYNWMVQEQEPIMKEHLILDSTHQPVPDLARHLQNYWLQCETDAKSDPYLQSPSWASKLSSID